MFPGTTFVKFTKGKTPGMSDNSILFVNVCAARKL